MLNKLKKFCRKNKFIFYISRVVYLPVKAFLLYKPKRDCKREAIEKLIRRDCKKPAIFYFGVPLHKNLGDLAQTYCTLRYFEKYWPEYEVLAMKTYSTYSKKYLKLLKKSIRDSDIIFFQSGYCTTDEHLDHTMHKIMLQQFPETRMVFLPQTVLFRNRKEREITCRIFNKHKRTLFLARDKVSFEYAEEMFSDLALACYPDIVTTLIGTEKRKEAGNGILLCVRNDYEQLYSRNDVMKLKQRLEQLVERVDITDTTCEGYSYQEIINNLEDVIYSKIRSFKEYQAVITDRYHGTIFSMIANVPVIVLSSNDHKVKTGIDWFKGVYDGMFYSADSMEEAYEMAKRAIRNTAIENKSYFEDRYYAGLRQIIEKI